MVLLVIIEQGFLMIKQRYEKYTQSPETVYEWSSRGISSSGISMLSDGWIGRWAMMCSIFGYHLVLDKHFTKISSIIKYCGSGTLKNSITYLDPNLF